eukprot:g14235.t1
MAIGNLYIILTIIIICSNIFHNVKALENKNKNKILRISFDKVEELNGEKIVVFVSNQGKSKAISKEAVQVLRNVKKEFDPIYTSNDNTKISYVRVDCSNKNSKEKCKAAGFTTFPRWFIHSVEGGIEELWNPSTQTSSSIMEFLKFRMLREKIHAPVNNLNSLNIISQLIVHRPVVVQYVMPWSGRSQRFEKHYLKTSLLQQEKYFFYTIDCDKHSDLCENENIGDYPTIRIYFPQMTTGNDGEKRNNNNLYSVDYEGNEIYNALSTFLNDHNIKAYNNMDEKRKFVNHIQSNNMQNGSGNDIVDKLQIKLDEFELRLKKWLAKGLKKMEKRITEKISKRIKKVVKDEL